MIELLLSASKCHVKKYLKMIKRDLLEQFDLEMKEELHGNKIILIITLADEAEEAEFILKVS